MLWNALLLALKEIKHNSLRSFLTILGIVIGVASVIIMITVGNGATLQVTQQIESLGSNLLIISPGQRIAMGQRSTAKNFKIADLESIKKNIKNISAIAPVSTDPTTVVYSNKNWSTNITGTDNEYFSAANWKISEGRLFTETESRIGKAVCILGNTVKKELFDNQNPIGYKIRLEKMSCQVIGLLKSKGQSTLGSDQDDFILLPLRTFHRRISGNTDIKRIMISVNNNISTEKVKEEIQTLLRKIRRVSNNEEDDFTVLDMKQIANMLSSTTNTLTMLLSSIAAVGLLVGGIGIMNIMLVSVSERTREIGIRLAIGAMKRDVLTQFLVEAVVLSVLGGIIGIIVALIGSVIIVKIIGTAFVLHFNIIITALLFSAGVGIIFGYFPALKAARLNPIDALRYE